MGGGGGIKASLVDGPPVQKERCLLGILFCGKTRPSGGVWMGRGWLMLSFTMCWMKVLR